MKKHEPPPGFATISAYARHRAVHRSYIGRLVEKGLLPHVVTPRGVKLIDIARADGVLDDLPATDELLGGVGEKQQSTYQQARLVKAVFDAKLMRMLFEERANKMISAAAARARIRDLLDAVGSGLGALADRMAPVIAAEKDRRKIHAYMASEIKSELTRLAAEIARQRKQQGDDL
jgi:hypothetical protein